MSTYQMVEVASTDSIIIVTIIYPELKFPVDAVRCCVIGFCLQTMQRFSALSNMDIKYAQAGWLSII